MSASNVAIQSEAEAIKGGTTEAQLWLDKIEDRKKSEHDWRISARLAIAVYEAKQRAEGAEGVAYSKPMFNIFHSNINTLVPAVYNSTPVPDVRRRFGEKDPIARLASTCCERALTASMDGYDIDHVFKRVVRSSCLAGRGVPRLRYVPKTQQVQDQPDTDPYDKVIHEDAKWEYVPWDRFGHGDAETWELVPFVYFEHDMTKEQVWELLCPDEPEFPEVPPEPMQPEVPEPFGDPGLDEQLAQEHAADMEQFKADARQYTTTLQTIAQMRDKYTQALEAAAKRLENLAFAKPGQGSGARDGAKPQRGILGTCKVFEVWDKASRSVIWIADKDTSQPLKVMPDPLGLANFFNVPRPLMQTEGESSLEPVCPHDVYASLVQEIDDVTKRIKAIIDDMKIRALGDPKLSADLERLAKADDGDVVSATVTENFVQGGGNKLADLVMFWPIEQDVQALQALMQHREAIKQIIYEVTGLSDILRGASNAGETATAQQIKATWGSQRVQDMQQEVARLAREMFRMTAELMFAKFQDDTIRQMTLLPPPLTDADKQRIAAAVPAQQPQVDPQTNQPQPMSQEAQQQLQAQHQQMIEQAIAQAEQQSEEQFKQAMQLLRDKLMYFRVDIETDSTIKADMARDQQAMNDFVQATGSFTQAIAGLVQIMPETRVPMFELYCAFVQKLKLGKQADDILDRLKEAAAQPVQTPSAGPDPRAEAEAAQMQDQMADRQHQREMESKQADGQNIQLKNEAITMKQDAARDSFGMRMFERRIDAAMPPQEQKYQNGSAQSFGT